MNERQIALSVLESLRGDLIYAHLNNGSRVLDVADLRQYIYEHMSRIRTSAFVMDGLYSNQNDQDKTLARAMEKRIHSNTLATAIVSNSAQTASHLP